MRRLSAADGLRVGLNSEGPFGRPASSAAWERDRSSACFEKNISAAASMPSALWPPTVPYGTSFMYCQSTHCFEWIFSSSEASLASRIFRWMSRFGFWM